MRFSESWMREWVNPALNTAELAEQLTMAGLEVAAVDPAAPAFSGVVVGHVLSVTRHPDADKLSVCQVDAGEGEPLQIVCGAANVAQGMKVPVAKVGAVLPGDFKIKKAKLRGVASSGMICSASELGLAESSSGIMPLPESAPIGEDFRTYLQLDDQCVDVDLTPNRGDCLSIAGLAREIGVLNALDVTPPALGPVQPGIGDTFPAAVHAPEACPRYLCRVVRGINSAAKTPLWMVERLRRSGIRSLGAVVDVTNYVMIELGQPMHGFDLAKVAGGIEVRMAAAGERLALLNGSEIELRPDSLVIADGERPLALAGVMGGERSGVSETTRDVLLESAFFSPQSISGKSRSYGLHTDSSHRFERGVDPALQGAAMERATALLLEVAGGQAGPVVDITSTALELKRQPVSLRRARVSRLLGIEVPDARIEDILSRLGMGVESDAEGWVVIPPTSRFDITREEDLIEEVGRIYGYDKIPATPGHSGINMSAPREAAFDLGRAKQLLVARGYHEVITYSFISPESAVTLAPQHGAIRLANPISADMSTMRPTLWAGLIQTANYNRARQQERIRIFESGLIFISQDNEIKQKNFIGGLLQGSRTPEQWGDRAAEVDFFDLKADVLALIELTAGQRSEPVFTAAEHPVLHPGQSARIEREGKLLGWMGLLHPALEKALDTGGRTYVFELDLDQLEADAIPAFAPISRYPAIRRDLAVVVDRDVTFAALKACVRRAAPDFLRDIGLFDVYTGENIESNRKSLALSLILQDSSRTLTDEDVTAATDAVMGALKSELNAKLRD